jgi:hypothetical protein
MSAIGHRIAGTLGGATASSGKRYGFALLMFVLDEDSVMCMNSSRRTSWTWKTRTCT